MKKPTIAVLGSHSALDVCRGAKDEGFATLVVAKKGREKTYAEIYATKRGVGCVDECLVLDDFYELFEPSVQKKLQKRNAIFVPHRSFEVYLKFAYERIEQEFKTPIFGNKYLLKIEERGRKPNQYDLLASAGIRYPRQYADPRLIDRLCMVKVAEAARPYERAFFLAATFDEYKKKSEEMMKEKKITSEALHAAVIEEFIVGASVNFNFFYSPIHNRLELIGTDTRRQTNLEGIMRVPGAHQEEVISRLGVSYEESGHIAVTVLESLLEQAFAMGEAFVNASRKFHPSGVIGPFALQSIIVPGPPKKDLIVVDVSPRMPGSPGIAASPYSAYLFGESLSMGRRVAREIRDAVSVKALGKVVT